MQAYKTASEQLNTQTNAKKSTKPTYSQLNEQWNDTPIWIRGNEETGYYATLGNYRITDILQCHTDIVDELCGPTARTVIQIGIAIQESYLEMTKTETEKTAEEKINAKLDENYIDNILKEQKHL